MSFIFHLDHAVPYETRDPWICGGLSGLGELHHAALITITNTLSFWHKHFFGSTVHVEKVVMVRNGIMDPCNISQIT